MEPPATDEPYVPRARIEVCPHHHRNHPMDRYACFHRRMTGFVGLAAYARPTFDAAI